MLSCNSNMNSENDFFTALALLKSSDQDSAMKLREMLLTCIARNKYCFDFKRIPIPSPSCEQVIPSNCANKNEIKSNPYCVKEKMSNKDENYDIVSNEDMEIPTISIPDEEFIDSNTCKVCGGIKMDPFILLECQDCQDTYHPLCHQPPAVDIDIYDPRLVWRCYRCIEIMHKNNKEVVANSIMPLMEKISDKQCQQNLNEDIEVKKNFSTKIKTYSSCKRKKVVK